MGKGFGKQIETIEDKVQKQIDALKDLKDQNKELDNISDYKDDLLHSKEWEIFKNIYGKRLYKTDDNNLIFTTLRNSQL